MARLGRPVRRMRLSIDDADVKVHLYANGFIRIHVDHPSDDILIEVAIAHRVMEAIRDSFADVGLGEPKLTDARWQSDPPNEPDPGLTPA